jgi:hypothetical protein
LARGLEIGRGGLTEISLAPGRGPLRRAKIYIVKPLRRAKIYIVKLLILLAFLTELITPAVWGCPLPADNHIAQPSGVDRK